MSGLFAAGLFLPFASAQQKNIQDGKWPCGNDPGLLVDKRSRPVWISSEELKQHSINAPTPKLPSSLRAAGTVTVDVLIGRDGHVKCSRAENGHPLLRVPILDVVTLLVSVTKKSINDALPVISETDFIFIAGKQTLLN